MLMHGAGATPIDTTPYERPNVLTEGQRRVDFVVNGQWRGVEEISFRRAGDGRVRPCYDRAMLQRAGVDLARSERGQDRDAPPEPMPDGLLCEPISRHVPGAELSFDQG
ncbi:FimD/PapC N-terminal domain-containing protein, partial [Ralstonia pickettii]|nr:FimD/PapC N-terminal domain-containing protein [Ralstonia pickettii]